MRKSAGTVNKVAPDDSALAAAALDFARARAYLAGKMGMARNENADDIVHPLALRLMHWINAFAVIAMILSGWRIYDAAPIFAFEFPRPFTLGGWLGGALAWHFAAMWLLVFNALAYAIYATLSGHFRRRFLPLSLSEAARDIVRGRENFTAHRAGRYNAAQRLIYVGVFSAVIVAVLSGAAIWKPVQWQALTALMGGYDQAREVHFYAMTLVALFLALHISLALTVQGVLVPMFTGRLERRR